MTRDRTGGWQSLRWISTADSGGADSARGAEGPWGTEGPGARQVAGSAVLGRGQASVAVTGDCY